MTERMPVQYKDKKENDADEEKKEKLTKIKIVPIELTYQKYEKGEKQVNQALKEGYHILKELQTESGVVMVMGFYSTSNNHDFVFGQRHY